MNIFIKKKIIVVIFLYSFLVAENLEQELECSTFTTVVSHDKILDLSFITNEVKLNLFIKPAIPIKPYSRIFIKSKNNKLNSSSIKKYTFILEDLQKDKCIEVPIEVSYQDSGILLSGNDREKYSCRRFSRDYLNKYSKIKGILIEPTVYLGATELNDFRFSKTFKKKFLLKIINKKIVYQKKFIIFFKLKDGIPTVAPYIAVVQSPDFPKGVEHSFGFSPETYTLMEHATSAYNKEYFHQIKKNFQIFPYVPRILVSMNHSSYAYGRSLGNGRFGEFYTILKETKSKDIKVVPVFYTYNYVSIRPKEERIAKMNEVMPWLNYPKNQRRPIVSPTIGWAKDGKGKGIKNLKDSLVTADGQQGPAHKYPVINASRSVRIYNPEYDIYGPSNLAHEVGHVWGLGHAAGIMFYMSGFYNAFQYYQIVKGSYTKTFVEKKDAMRLKGNYYLGDISNYIYLHSGYARIRGMKYKLNFKEKNIIMPPKGTLSSLTGFDSSKKELVRIIPGHRSRANIPCLLFYFQPKDSGKYKIKIIFKAKDMSKMGMLSVKATITGAPRYKGSYGPPFMINNKYYIGTRELKKYGNRNFFIYFSKIASNDKYLKKLSNEIYSYQVGIAQYKKGNSYPILLSYLHRGNKIKKQTTPLFFKEIRMEKM